MQDKVELPGHWNAVSLKLNAMRKSGLFTDVVFVCKGRKFDAHKDYLSASSEYFYHMFNSHLKEATEHEIDFPSLEPESLDNLLEILYSGTLVEVPFEHLKPLLKASHLMQFQTVYLHYRKIFISKLTKQNFMEGWETGDELQDGEILSAVWKLVSNCNRDIQFNVINARRMGNLIRYLLRMNYLSSDFLLALMMKWTTALGKNKLEQLLQFIKYTDEENISKYQIDLYLKDVNLRKKENSEELFQNILRVSLETCQHLFCQQSLNIAELTFLIVGENTSGNFKFQKYVKGSWQSKFDFNCDSNTVDVVVAIGENGSFYAVVKESYKDSFYLYVCKFDELGTRQKKKFLTKTTMYSQIDIVICNKILFVSEYQEFTKWNILVELPELIPRRSLKFSFRQKLRKLKTLCILNDIYQISQEEVDNGEVVLMLRKFVPSTFKWLHLKSCICTATSGWCAYTEYGQAVVRFFPGKSKYFTIKAQVEEKEEKNEIPNVVSAETNHSGVWVLTADGSIFFQGKAVRNNNSLWHFAMKMPESFEICKQLVLF